jgi:hypothetical protein
VKYGISIAVLLVALVLPRSDSAADDTTLVKGKCAPQSYIAEGAISEDLTKRQSRFFCDSAVVTSFSDNPRHVMVQFAEFKSTLVRILAYAGMMDNPEIMTVSKVYLEPGKSSPVVDGHCKFFFKEKRISGIACGGMIIDESGRRIVPIVAFNADPSSPPAQLHSPPMAGQNEGVPYDKSGVANCSLPGTVIEFALDGRGGAEVTRIESNYPPFQRAAEQTRVWQANLVDMEGNRLLVLDDGRGTRIMVMLPDGRGMAFSARDGGGASDILCQVLVSP